MNILESSRSPETIYNTMLEETVRFSEKCENKLGKRFVLGRFFEESDQGEQRLNMCDIRETINWKADQFQKAKTIDTKLLEFREFKKFVRCLEGSEALKKSDMSTRVSVEIARACIQNKGSVGSLRRVKIKISEALRSLYFPIRGGRGVFEAIIEAEKSGAAMVGEVEEQYKNIAWLFPNEFSERAEGVRQRFRIWFDAIIGWDSGTKKPVKREREEAKKICHYSCMLGKRGPAKKIRKEFDKAVREVRSLEKAHADYWCGAESGYSIGYSRAFAKIGS